MESSRTSMPLTKFQSDVAKLLAVNRTPDSFLAGGAALHFAPNSIRYSNDLDFFQDAVERVAAAFADDSALLLSNRYQLLVDMHQPGFISATVSRETSSTKVDWAHDSAWRFMPTVSDPDCGYRLHPVDLAINKVLALVGRDEPRDFLDTMDCHDRTLSLGALCWAAAGKDPGFTPASILEYLKRKGRYREEDFARLHLTQPIRLVELKAEWLAALSDAEQFIASRPMEEVGCLYYSPTLLRFIAPEPERTSKDYLVHFGALGGILPQIRS